jgi:hypothetical protein
MPKLGIYSKETKEFLYELNISQEVYDLLMKQNDPSKVVEKLMRDWMKEEGQKKKCPAD